MSIIRKAGNMLTSRAKREPGLKGETKTHIFLSVRDKRIVPLFRLLRSHGLLSLAEHNT